MSDLATLAGGVVMAGFDGREPAADTPLFGGWILFARNGTSVEDVRAVTDGLRVRYPRGAVPPLLAIDQEGGRVVRLREGTVAMPSAMALGAGADPGLIGRVGEQVAHDLRRAGCSMNFAPVLDLALEPANTVIGTRAFGDDPAMVAQLATAFAEGLERAGAIACFKHFPGHGATSADSHVGAAPIRLDPPTWRARDLAPFAAVARGARAMMSGHVRIEGIDPARPASRSARISTGILRGELGFEGVLVTDCLFMQAASGEGGVVHASIEALQAGADLLLVSRSVETAQVVVAAIVQAVENGQLGRERLEEAHRRVLRLRAAALPPLDVAQRAPHPGVGREAARAGVTLIRGIPHADPVASLVCAFRGSVESGAEERRAAASRRDEAPALVEWVGPLEPSDRDVDALLATLAREGRRAIVLMHRAHLHEAQAGAVQRVIATHPDAIVVSTGEPFDLSVPSRARHLLATYGDDRTALGALADVLFGGSPPRGRLPVEAARV